MSNNKTKSENPKPKSQEQEKKGKKMASYKEFVDWHVDRIYHRPYPGRAHDYMDFPIVWDRSCPLIERLHYIFKAYIKELKEFDERNQKERQSCKEICESILWIIAKTMNLTRRVGSNVTKCNTNDAFDKIFDILYKYGLKKNIINLSKEKDTLYRLRSQKYLLKREDFYHIPFDELYLSNSERFSAMGHPCLYLGYSEEDCLIELEQKKGTIAEYHIRKNLDATNQINVLDLTLPTFEKQKDSTIMFLVWPLLAACYVAVPRPETIHVNFKEEYVFPQQLTRYLLEKEDVDGIRYYSCRNRLLDPTIKDYMNLVLFSEMPIKEDFYSLDSIPTLTSRYDNNLMKVFEIKNIHTVDYEKSES